MALKRAFREGAREGVLTLERLAPRGGMMIFADEQAFDLVRLVDAAGRKKSAERNAILHVEHDQTSARHPIGARGVGELDGNPGARPRNRRTDGGQLGE